MACLDKALRYGLALLLIIYIIVSAKGISAADAEESKESESESEPAGGDLKGKSAVQEESATEESAAAADDDDDDDDDDNAPAQKPSGGRNEDEDMSIDSNDELYSGNDVKELLSLCQNTTLEEIPDPVTREPTGKFSCYPEDASNCIRKCTPKRLERLRDAQNRTRMMLEHLGDFYNVTWQVLAFLVVFILGVYLIVQGHFNWRTLPIIGNPFEVDPTDGYRYSHYMWMQWVTLASNSPSYYTGMTPETKELEYTPQIQLWHDPDADSDPDLQPAWSIRDIYDMTADLDERLEFYFRRIQQKYQVSKQGRQNIKKFKQKKAN